MFTLNIAIRRLALRRIVGRISEEDEVHLPNLKLINDNCENKTKHVHSVETRQYNK